MGKGQYMESDNCCPDLVYRLVTVSSAPLFPDGLLDNMGKPGGDNNEPSGANDDAVFEDAEAEMRSPVRLAAQSLISHFINHLFHFPMETGNFFFEDSFFFNMKYF